MANFYTKATVCNTIYIRKRENEIQFSTNNGSLWTAFETSSEFTESAITLAHKSAASVLVLPSISENIAEKIVVIGSINADSSFLNLLEIPSVNLFQADEKISFDGKIIHPISEPEINKILRFCFTIKPTRIFICLTNGLINPLHERILKNILRNIGFDVTVSADFR